MSSRAIPTRAPTRPPPAGPRIDRKCDACATGEAARIQRAADPLPVSEPDGVSERRQVVPAARFGAEVFLAGVGRSGKANARQLARAGHIPVEEFGALADCGAVGGDIASFPGLQLWGDNSALLLPVDSVGGGVLEDAMSKYAEARIYVQISEAKRMIR